LAVHELHEHAKKKARSLADAIGTFGVGILEPGQLDYGSRVGIILNQQRIEKRRVVTILEALSSSLSPVLDKSLFEAVAETPEQAQAMYQAYEARMKVEESLAQWAGARGGM